MAQPFKALARMLSPNTSLSLSPVARSRLAQQLLAQSQSGQMGIVSGYGTAAKLVNALKARQAGNQERQEAEQTAARQQGLAGALSRTSSGNPAQAEAARRASMIIAGGLPNDPTAQGLLQGQAKAQFSGPDNLFGVVNPSDFTPESLQKFSQTRRYGDLTPRENIYGRYTPSQYTAESWAKFKNSNDPVDLVLRPEFRFSSTPSGAVVAGNTLSGQVTPTSVTPEVATAEAAERKRVEAEASAAGEAKGVAQGALPAAEQAAQTALETIDDLRSHPGRTIGTGASRIGQIQNVPGTAAYDFEVALKQAKGQVFLNAYQGLKGTGNITEVEGQKAEQAIARMDAAQSEGAFLDALDDLELVIRRGVATARKRAGVPQDESPQGGGMPNFSNMSDEELKRLAGVQ